MLIFGVLALLAIPSKAQCVAVGMDTTCGVIITVIQTGNTPCPPQGCASVSFTGQGPYDGIDDTLVGVVNNSKQPLTSLVLTSGNDIFGFDGDGICGLDPNTGLPYVPAPPACPYGPTGYEGPGVSFSNYSSTTTGTVNFSPAVPANGGTAYFSLENSLTAATACSSVVNGSVPKPPGGGVNIQATFTPNLGYALSQAAQLCGFTGFDWQQTITYMPNPSPYCENNSAYPIANPMPFCKQTSTSPPPYPIHLNSSWVPFNDPPPNGYTYGFFNSFPFYYPSGTITADESSGIGTLCIEQNASGTCLLYDVSGGVLNFHDSPSDPCFIGGGLVNTADCGFGSVPASEGHIGFTTHLAGVNSSGTPIDLGIGFSWTDSFNGGSSGSISTGTIGEGNPTGGTGSITITGSSQTTAYQYPPGVGVTAINGNSVTPPSSTSTLLAGSQIAATASGLAYSRITKTFNGTVTITNISSSTITGPFQIVLDSLTADVTLANATSGFGGWSYITVPAVGSLAPGKSATVSVEFSNPSNATINFAPITYSGSFN